MTEVLIAVFSVVLLGALIAMATQDHRVGRR
jgi:hypothetical protein